jgi:hypothetical protein
MVINECGAVGQMRIGRGDQSTQRKPAPMPLCPQQIPHDLTCDRTVATAVETFDFSICVDVTSLVTGPNFGHIWTADTNVETTPLLKHHAMKTIYLNFHVYSLRTSFILPSGNWLVVCNKYAG